MIRSETQSSVGPGRFKSLTALDKAYNNKGILH
jgi:hypothetical protein